jgi:hypothetical protein
LAGQKYQRSSDFIYRKIINEMVLVPIHLNIADMESIYTLNDVGASIWERLEEPISLEQLASELVNEYDSDPETITQELILFLQELQECGAVLEVQP